MIAAGKLRDLYRRLPNGVALFLAFLASFSFALIIGVLGGIAAMYLSDRASSKSDDVAIGMGGVFSIGVFTVSF